MTARPKPKPPQPALTIQTAGDQAQFSDAAGKLAAALGWVGDDDWVQYDIEVRDARRYLQKVMHEHFIAAARGLPQPDYKAACKHLAVDTPAEQNAIDAALKAAYDAGKGAKLSEHPVRYSNLGRSPMRMG